MADNKVTPWFSMREKPTRPGVYQVRTTGCSNFYSKWTGKCWTLTGLNVDDAAKQRERSNSCYNGEVTAWRGLAQGGRQ
jgi:hypothetical protein